MGYNAEIKKKVVKEKVVRKVEYPKIDERTGYPTGEVGTLKLTE
jgi:hypothetical protein